MEDEIWVNEEGLLWIIFELFDEGNFLETVFGEENGRF